MTTKKEKETTNNNFIICGLPNSGQKELYDLLKSSLSDKYSFNEPGLSILDNPIKKNTINFNLFDLTRIAEFGSGVKFIICIRDIRDILCDQFLFNESLTYVNDWNCRYMTDDLIKHDLIINSTTSFGLRYYYNIIKELSDEQKLNCVFITYEQLMSGPIECQLDLLDFNDFDFDSDFDLFEINELILFEQKWKGNTSRIKDQVCKFPELIDAVDYFNMDNNGDWYADFYDEEQVNLNALKIKSEMGDLQKLIATSLANSVLLPKKTHPRPTPVVKTQLRNQTKQRKIGNRRNQPPEIQTKKKIRNQVNIQFKKSK